MSEFSDRISTLCASNDQVAQLCRTLLDLNGADGASGQLGALGAVIEELCRYLETWLGRAESTALRENFGRVRGDLEDIYKIGIRFRVVATLTAVNATSNTTSMDGFIEELRAVPVQIRAAVDTLLSRLSKVDTVVLDAVRTAKVGLNSLGVARDQLLGQSDSTASILRQAARAREEMGSIGNAFLSQSQAQTKVLVRGFQYSDFFAQRLDHVAQMLGREEEYGPAVLLLAARQLSDLAEDGRETVRDIESALRTQSGTVENFTRNFSEQVKLGAGINAELQGIFQSVMTSRDEALPVIAKSVASSRLVLAEIELCNESFARLVEMSGVMDLAAINARIRASREDRARAAMAFLSGAVTEGASTCRDVLSKSSAGLETVANLQNAEMLDLLVDCVTRFSAAFEACRNGLTASQDLASRLSSTLAEVSGLGERSQILLEECQRTAESLKGIVQSLSAFSARLSAGLVAPKVWPDMTPVYDTYTIQAERDTHDRLIGREILAPEPIKQPELDDIFF